MIGQRVNKLHPESKFLMAQEIEKAADCNLTFESKVCFNALLFKEKYDVPYIATQLWNDEEVVALLSDGAEQFLSPTSARDFTLDVKKIYQKLATTFYKGILSNYRIHSNEDSVTVATDILKELIDQIFPEPVKQPMVFPHPVVSAKKVEENSLLATIEPKKPEGTSKQSLESVQVSDEKEKRETIPAETREEPTSSSSATSETKTPTDSPHPVIEEKSADSSSLVTLEHVTFHSMINRGGGILECRQVGGGERETHLCYFELNDLNIDSQTNIQIVIKILLNQFSGLQIKYRGQRTDSGKAIQFVCDRVCIVGDIPVPVKMKTQSDVPTIDESKLKRFSEVESLFSKGKFLLLSSIEFSPKVEMVHHSVKCMINEQSGILECHAKSDKLQLSILSYFEVSDLNFEGQFDVKDLVEILSTKSEDFVVKYRAKRVDSKKSFPFSNVSYICESIEVRGKLPSHLCRVKLGKKKSAKFVNSDKLDRFVNAQKLVSAGKVRTLEEILSKK